LGHPLVDRDNRLVVQVGHQCRVLLPEVVLVLVGINRAHKERLELVLGRSGVVVDEVPVVVLVEQPQSLQVVHLEPLVGQGRFEHRLPQWAVVQRVPAEARSGLCLGLKEKVKMVTRNRYFFLVKIDLH
jgi:hypothetical protein